jgi:hypothetical protein
MTTGELKLNANSRKDLTTQTKPNVITNIYWGTGEKCRASNQDSKTVKTLHENLAVESISLLRIPKSFRGRPDKIAKNGRKMTLVREASPQCDVNDRQVCF